MSLDKTSLLDEIMDKIKEAGFSIAMAKEVALTREEAEDFYAEHKGKDFFESLVQNMCRFAIIPIFLSAWAQPLNLLYE